MGHFANSKPIIDFKLLCIGWHLWQVHFGLQWHGVDYIIQYSTVLYCTVPYFMNSFLIRMDSFRSRKQVCKNVQYGTVQFSTQQYITVQHCIVWYSQPHVIVNQIVLGIVRSIHEDVKFITYCSKLFCVWKGQHEKSNCLVLNSLSNTAVKEHWMLNKYII